MANQSARQVINDTLRSIWVTGDEEPIANPDMNRAIRIFNDMMAAFEVRGIDLDFTPIVDQIDSVTVVDGAYSGVKACLAVELWRFYFKTDPPTMMMSKYRQGKRDLRRLSYTQTELDYPNTLPVGTGNQVGWYGSARFFTEDN